MKDDKTTGDGRPRSALLRPFLLPGVLAEDDVDYQPLAEFGACYDATMTEILQAGLQAQKQRASTSERRRASRELRNSHWRLILDLWHLQPDERVFGSDAVDAPELPEPQPPELRWPKIEPPSKEALLDAVRDVPLPAPPPALATGNRPAIAPDLWALLEEIWPDTRPLVGPVSPPASFLEELP